MPTARFNLNRRSQDPALILLVFRVQGFRFVYSTGQWVSPRYWDTGQGRVKSTNVYRPGAAINSILNKIESETAAFYAESVASGKGFDFRSLRLRLDAITMRSSADTPTRMDLIRFMEYACEQRKQKGAKKSTLNTYKAIIGNLTQFRDENNADLDFSQIDYDFFYSFIQFMYSKGMTTNSVSIKIATLNSFLRDAETRGISVPPAYKTSHARVPQVPTYQVYLSEPELESIENLELREESNLETARDIFLLSCWIGIRYSDLSQIKAENFREKGGVLLLDITQQKTTDPITVPVTPKAREILEKHNYNPVLRVSLNTYNDLIKDLCRAAKIKTPIVVQEFSGGKRKEVIKEKWEMVSAHTARRTFATNAHKSGIPTLMIAKLTGHKTEKSLLKYIRVTGEETALLIARNNPFFSQEGKGEEKE